MSLSSASENANAVQNARAIHRARVIERREVAPRHFLLRLAAPALSRHALPGQFVHVLPHFSASDAANYYDPLLRRAFSLMAANRAAETCDILFRVEGRGTALLSGVEVNDLLDLIGPLGKPFDLAPLANPARKDDALFHVKQRDAKTPARAVLVGGGVGVPPLVFLANHLSASGVAVDALIGARTRSDVLGATDFEKLNIGLEIATDDGSAGLHGRVTELLEKNLGLDANAIVYSCGPWPMLRAVAEVCERAQVPCQVSLEEAMPCGIGVCNGCVVRARAPFAQQEGAAAPTKGESVGDEWSPYHQYRRICVEGPACWAHEIEWRPQ